MAVLLAGQADSCGSADRRRELWEGSSRTQFLGSFLLHERTLGYGNYPCLYVSSSLTGNQTAWLKAFISFYKTNSWATSLEGLCCRTPRILPRLEQGTRSLKQSSTDRTAGSTSAWLNAFIILEICCHSWNDVRAILGSASTVATTVTRKHVATRPMGRTFEGCSLRRKRAVFSGWPGFQMTCFLKFTDFDLLSSRHINPRVTEPRPDGRVYFHGWSSR